MLVKCTPSAHRRGCHCLPNKQTANYQTSRLQLLQPTLFDWMKHLFFGKIPLLILLVFGIQNASFGQCTDPDLTNPQANCFAGYQLSLDGNGLGTVFPADINNNSTDNCGIASLAVSPNNFDCGDVNMTIAVTLTVTDAAGNSNSCMSNIMVVDNVMPVITCPMDTVVNCPNPTTPPGTGVATATDNCGLAAAPSVGPNALPSGYIGPVNSFYYYSDASNPTGNPGECDVITRTWRVYDESENFAECTQTITLTDTGNPVFDFDPGTPGSQSATTTGLSETIQCDEAIPPAATPTAIDACDNSPTIDPVDEVSTKSGDPTSCTDYNYTITRTYTVTDDCGNVTTDSYVITVQDTIAPDFSGAPTSLNISSGGNCSTFVTVDLTGIPDNCASANLTTTYEVVTMSGSVVDSGNGLDASGTYDVGMYDFIFTATDPCGNSSMHTVEVNINDNTAPTAICFSNIEVSITSDGIGIVNPANVNNGSSDNCTMQSDLILSVSPDTLTCDSIAASPVVGTLTVMDANGNTATCNTSINVVDNSDPAAFCQDITAILVGDTISVYAAEIDGGSNDACANPLVLQISRDGGTTFQDSVMFRCPNAGDNDVILQVDDSNGQTSTCMAVVTVVDTVAPVAMCNAITISLDIDGMYDLTATDSTNIVTGTMDNCSFTTSFSKSMFDCDDIDLAEVMANGSEVDTIEVIYTDLSSNMDTCMAFITIEDNVVPMVSCADITVELNSDGMMDVFPTELLAGDLYLSSGNNDSGMAGNLDFGVNITTPVEITFDWNFVTADTTGADTLGYVINGEFTALAFMNGTSSGSIAIPIQLFGSDDFSFQMKTTDNRGGAAEAWISNFSATLNGDFAMANWTLNNTNSDGKAFFVDACQPITYEISDDAGATWQDMLTFDCTSAGPQAVVIRAIDNNSNPSAASNSCTVTVRDDQAPIASCDEVVTGVDGGGNVIILAEDFDQGSMDACGGALTFRVSDDNATTFVDTLMYNCMDVDSVYSIILEVSDVSMNTAFCVTEVTIQDNAAPVMNCPNNVTIDCSQGTGTNITGDATAMDNCSTPLVVLMNDNTDDGPFVMDTCQVITRTFTATDASNNTGLCFQTIVVEDTEDPVFDMATIPVDTTIDCSANAVPELTATDNCTSPITPAIDTVDSRFNYAVTPAVNTQMPSASGFYNYTITREWTATDDCGNEATVSQIVTVQDTTGPIFNFPMTLPSVQNDAGSCAAFVDLDLENFIEDCADYQFLTVTNDATMQFGNNHGDGMADASGVYNAGTHTINFNAEDPSGNDTDFAVTFTVVDSETPNPACKPGGGTVSLNSSGFAPITVAMVDNGSSDNCGLASLTISPSSVDCDDVPNSPITVTLTATDNAGQTNTCTTTFNVVENSPPSIVCPANVTVECSDSLDPDMNPDLGMADVTTTCMNSIQPTFADVTTPNGSNPDCRTIERTWTATNSVGSATCAQIITVIDTIAPVFTTAIRMDTTVNCNAIPDPLDIAATDNCAMPPAVLYEENIDGQDPDPTECDHYQYDIIRKWTAEDNCGNMTVDSVIITVIDTLSPEMNFPMPLIVDNDPDECFATVNVDLSDYITDCAAFQFLDVENNAQDLYQNGNGTDNINGQYAIGDYPIEVIAEDPCGNIDTVTFTLSVRDTETPNAVCDSENILVLDNNGNGTITPADIDEGSSDNCGNVTLSLSQTMFTSADVGTINLVLTATDDAGNTSSCNTQLTVIERPRLTVGNVSGQMGSTTSVPVLVENFENICGIQATFTVDDVNVASVTGVSNFNLEGLAATDFAISGNTITLDWIDADASGVDLDGVVIFTIDVELVGNNGDVSTISIDTDPNNFIVLSCMNGGIGLASTGVNGSVTVTANPMAFNVSGRIATSSNDNIGLVNVAMTGSAGGSQVTDSTGLYDFLVDGGNTITIEPSKDINPKNGVNVIDVLIVKAHVLGNAALTDPFQLIAANVNNDASVNIIDQFLIHSLVIDNTSAFSSVESWKFIESSYGFSANPLTDPYPQSVTFNSLSADQSNVDFTGVKMGDVSQSANPMLSIGGNTSGGSIFNGATDRADDLYFKIDNQTLTAGTTISVPFKAKDFINQAAYQFTLDFDPTVLNFVNVTPGALPELTENHFGTTNLAEGLLPALWYNVDATTLADDEVLFTLTFDVLADADNLSDLLSIVDAPTTAAAFDADLNPTGIDLEFDNATNTTFATEVPVLLANQPNPFRDETQISFSLPQAGQAKLTISDVSGKALKTVEGYYNTGLQTIILKGDDFPAAGIYFYQLDTEWGALTQKMVVQK